MKKELYTLFSSHRHISAIAVLKNKKVILASAKQVILFNLKTKNKKVA